MKKRRRLKKWVRNTLSIMLGIIGITLGVVSAGDISVFAEEPVTDLVIADGVGEIGRYAYVESGLKSVTIPDSVQTIGYGAFEDCSNLSNVNIGNGVSTIDGHAFSGCIELNSVNIPGSVTDIGNGAFHNCVSLETASLPGSVTTLSNNAFYGCSGLNSVHLPEGMKTIGQQAFYGCTSLDNVAVPSSTSTICDGAFYNCFNMNQIVIGNGVSEIGKDAFAGCNNLTIVCNPGSYAESYAASNGIKYIYADGSAPTAASPTEVIPEGDQLLVTQNAEMLATLPEAVDNGDLMNVQNQIQVETQVDPQISDATRTGASGGNKKAETIVYTPQTGVDIPYVQVIFILAIAIFGMYASTNKKKHKILSF